jgi:hypothetical protein
MITTNYFIRNIPLFIVFTIACVGCGSKSRKPGDALTRAMQPANSAPDFNYIVDVPAGWSRLDTFMQGLNIRLLRAPDSLVEVNPVANILISSMNGRNIDAFTEANIEYLLRNLEQGYLLEKGKIDIGDSSARWFTYYREENGVKRDMINYIIPSVGFAYMITGGVNAGHMNKYRPVFDGIAQSFRLK